MGRRKNFAAPSGRDIPGNTPADTPKTTTGLNAACRLVATATFVTVV